MKHLLPITFILSVLTCCNAFAQEWHFGPTASYVNTSMKLKSDSVDVTYRNMSGFQVGCFVEYEIREYIGIQSGILFTMSGYQAEEGVVYKQQAYAIAKEKTRLFNLMFPVIIEGKIPLGDFSINLEAGPQFYAGLTGHTTIKTRNGEEFNYSDIYNETLDRFNCDIHFGLGFQYVGARLIFGYNLGVYNVLDKDSFNKSKESAKLSGFVVSFAYMF